MEDRKNSSDETSKKGFWTLGDKTWIDLLLPFIGAIWTVSQIYSQKQEQNIKEELQQEVEQTKTLENYFTSLQSLENDIFKYTLPSGENTDNSATENVKEREEREKKESKRTEAAKIIQSLAIAKTLIAFENLDEKRKGQIIEYLHNSNLIPKSYSDYDSSNNYICHKLKEDKSDIDAKMIDLSVQVRMNDIDLSDKNLPGISLAGAGIKKFIFTSANLDCSSFKKTVIVDTKFNGAQLRGANFSKAFLNGVDFSDSNLRDADFSEASVIKDVNFTNAYLTNANFTNANFTNANFTNAYLSNVKGLTSAKLKTTLNWEKAFYIYDEKCDEKNKIVEYIVNEKANEDYIRKIKNDEALPPPSPKPPIKCSFN